MNMITRELGILWSEKRHKNVQYLLRVSKYNFEEDLTEETLSLTSWIFKHSTPLPPKNNHIITTFRLARRENTFRWNTILITKSNNFHLVYLASA